MYPPALFASSIRCAVFTAIAAFAAVPAAAENSDTGVWLTATVRGNVTDNVAVTVDAIARFSDDRDGLSQAIGRGQLSHRASPSISVEGGYGRFVSYDNGRVTQREHRLYQHLVWRMGGALGGRWTSRTRLEQRLVQQADTTGLRLRQRIAYARTLSDDVTLGASTEAFFALNDTDFGARSGFDALRSTADVTWAVSDAIDLELGYVNQWQSRRDRTDVLLHAASMGLAFKF